MISFTPMDFIKCNSMNNFVPYTAKKKNNYAKYSATAVSKS